MCGTKKAIPLLSFVLLVLFSNLAKADLSPATISKHFKELRDTPDLHLDCTAEDQIGQGSAGLVYKCLDTETNESVAVKAMPWECKYNDNILRLCIEQIKEIGVLTRAVGSQYLLQLVRTPIFKETNVYLVLEYHPESLFRLFNVFTVPNFPGQWPTMNLKTSIGNLVMGLKELYKMGVAYLDLNPRNILLRKSNRNFVLADFGSATADLSAVLDVTQNHHCKECEAFIPTDRYAFYTTRLWRAPELFASETFYGRAADYWSLGIVIYNILTQGGFPFQGDTDIETFSQIQGLFGTLLNPKEFTFPNLTIYESDQNTKNGFAQGPEQTITLIKALLQLDPQKRQRDADPLLNALVADPAIHPKNRALKEVPMVWRQKRTENDRKNKAQVMQRIYDVWTDKKWSLPTYFAANEILEHYLDTQEKIDENALLLNGLGALNLAATLYEGKLISINSKLVHYDNHRINEVSISMVQALWNKDYVTFPNPFSPLTLLTKKCLAGEITHATFDAAVQKLGDRTFDFPTATTGAELVDQILAAK